MSREIERLSKLLRKLYFATGMHELASWSDQLKYMGRDTQMSSRRFRSWIVDAADYVLDIDAWTAGVELNLRSYRMAWITL